MSALTKGTRTEWRWDAMRRQFYWKPHQHKANYGPSSIYTWVHVVCSHFFVFLWKFEREREREGIITTSALLWLLLFYVLLLLTNQREKWKNRWLFLMLLFFFYVMSVCMCALINVHIYVYVVYDAKCIYSNMCLFVIFELFFAENVQWMFVSFNGYR